MPKVLQIPCGRASFELRTYCIQVCAPSPYCHWALGMYMLGTASLLSRNLQVRARDHLCWVGKRQRSLFERCENPTGIWKLKRISPGGTWEGKHIPGAENQQEAAKGQCHPQMTWGDVPVHWATSFLIPHEIRNSPLKRDSLHRRTPEGLESSLSNILLTTCLLINSKKPPLHSDLVSYWCPCEICEPNAKCAKGSSSTNKGTWVSPVHVRHSMCACICTCKHTHINTNTHTHRVRKRTKNSAGPRSVSFKHYQGGWVHFSFANQTPGPICSLQSNKVNANFPFIIHVCGWAVCGSRNECSP